jgi:hypothetical protein
MIVEKYFNKIILIDFFNKKFFYYLKININKTPIQVEIDVAIGIIINPIF